MVARTGKPAARQVESVQRAINVLNVLAEARGELGTNEIARRTGLNVSSVSRLLATLVDGGLVQHVPATGRYRLGIRILQLASAARENLDLRVLARPYLEELTQITGETATLSLPGAHDVLTVDFVQSDSSVRSVAAIGRNSVAHATAVGKVFLAWGGRCPTASLPPSRIGRSPAGRSWPRRSSRCARGDGLRPSASGRPGSTRWRCRCATAPVSSSPSSACKARPRGSPRAECGPR